MNHEEVKAFFSENDKLGRLLDIKLLEVGAGRAKTTMEIKPEHLNGAGIAHGGAIFTLADVAFAAACNSHGQISLAANANISFLRPAGKGALYAEAEEISLSRKLGNYSIRVTDSQGNMIAFFQGLAYRKEASLESLAN